MKHGTRATYAKGCRCEKCLDVIAADAWGRRQLKTWDQPLKFEFELPESSYEDNYLEHITPEMVNKCVRKYEARMKLDLMRKVWFDVRKPSLIRNERLVQNGEEIY